MDGAAEFSESCLSSDGSLRGRLRSVAEYIDKNPAARLLVSDLACIAGVSPSWLKILFRESFGTSVHQYVIRRRVELALQLLCDGRARFSDVAQQVGFADQSHMVRCIRRVTGMTPGQHVLAFRSAPSGSRNERLATADGT